MATITALSTGLQTITATGAVTPTAGVDVSGMTGDAMFYVEVVSMTSGKTARIQLEDTDQRIHYLRGALRVRCRRSDRTGRRGVCHQHPEPDNRRKQSVRKYQLPNSNIGITSGKVRLNVTAIDSSAELALNAWIET